MKIQVPDVLKEKVKEREKEKSKEKETWPRFEPGICPYMQNLWNLKLTT